MGQIDDCGAVEIQDIEEIPAEAEPVSVLVPIVEGIGGSAHSQVEIGEDVELTPALADDLAGELGMGANDVRQHLARTFETHVDDLLGDTTVGGSASQRGDMWRAALSENNELPSSLVRGADRWHVTGVTSVSEGAARVSFGRRGLRELGAVMASDAAEGLKPGDPVLGTEVLWPGRGFMGLGKAKVEFVPDPDPPKPVPIWVPLMRLHRPKGDGCEATYRSESNDAKSIEMTLSILGVGAKGGYKIGMNLSDAYTARSTCVETVIPAKLQLLPGKTVINGTEVAYGIHAKVIEADPDRKKTRSVPRADDDCERSSGGLSGLISSSYDLGEAPKGDTKTEVIGVETETYGRLSVGPEMGGAVPIKLGMDYERSTGKKTEIEVQLATGLSYRAYAPLRRAGATLGQQIEICWTTKR